MSQAELHGRLGGNSRDLVILDIREKDAFEAGHAPGAHHLPRGQLELRVDHRAARPDGADRHLLRVRQDLDLAAATLRELGYSRAVALDGGMKAWREAGYPTES